MIGQKRPQEPSSRRAYSRSITSTRTIVEMCSFAPSFLNQPSENRSVRKGGHAEIDLLLVAIAFHELENIPFVIAKKNDSRARNDLSIIDDWVRLDAFLSQ